MRTENMWICLPGDEVLASNYRFNLKKKKPNAIKIHRYYHQGEFKQQTMTEWYHYYSPPLINILQSHQSIREAGIDVIQIWFLLFSNLLFFMQHVWICGCEHSESDGNTQSQMWAVVVLDCLTSEERDRPFKDIMASCEAAGNRGFFALKQYPVSKITYTYSHTKSLLAWKHISKNLQFIIKKTKRPRLSMKILLYAIIIFFCRAITSLAQSQVCLSSAFSKRRMTEEVKDKWSLKIKPELLSSSRRVACLLKVRSFNF